MSTLYIVRAQPNPPGKDAASGQTTNERLNEEWLEFEAINGDRTLLDDQVLHLTFSNSCSVTGQDVVFAFGSGTLNQGNRIRLHTGSGQPFWSGKVYHMYMGRGWFVWNNWCGDRITVRYHGSVVDSAGYAPRPPEGVLVRVPGTDRLEPVRVSTSAWSR